MRRLRRLLRMSRGDIALLVQAAALLVSIRAGLWCVPFATLRKILAGLATGKQGGPVSSEVRAVGRAIWAVETAGRQFPAVGTCLIQALAAYVLLGRRGCVADLRIGVKRDDEGKFVAHAWLEKEGAILIGGEPHHSYIAMPGLNGLECHSPAEPPQGPGQGQSSRPMMRCRTDLLATRLD